MAQKLEIHGMMCINWNDIFTYKDGQLIWKISPSYKIKEGAVAGNKTGPGYWQICFKGKFYKLHRIIWQMFYGEIPQDLEIDHIDRDKDNNRIENLRLATRSENANNRDAQSNNKLGVAGVVKDGNKFVAYIRINNKTVNLGRFNTILEASSTYQKAKLEI